MKALKKEKLTQKRLHEVLDYDPSTGICIWKINKGFRYIKGKTAGWDDNGYRRIEIDGRVYRAHRLAFMWMDGYFPENDVDHIDRNKANNKWDNLREASRSCNVINSKISIRNTSGITGITFSNQASKWQAYISIPKKLLHLGFFKKKNNAVMARWEAEIKYNYPACNTTSSAYLYLKERGLTC